MKKIFFLISIIFLLNGCAQSIALLGTSASGASSGKIVQSSINSVTSYGIKKKNLAYLLLKKPIQKFVQF